MSVETQEYEHRGYNIVVTNKPPIFQAAIYATEPGMADIDWTTKPIEAINVRGAEIEARSRIDLALSKP